MLPSMKMTLTEISQMLQVETLSTLTGKGKQDIENTSHVKKTKSMIGQLDTEASCNVISYHNLSMLLQTDGTPKLGQISVKLKMYDGSIMRPTGETCLTVEHNGSYHTVKFQVVDSPKKILLSSKSCEGIGLLQFNLNIPQDVHVLRRTANPLSPKMLS